MSHLSSLLRQQNLRVTKPRCLVLDALAQCTKPASHKEVHQWICTHDDVVDLVTVYRVLERLQEKGIVHRHPTTGGFTLCSIPEMKGHHGFLTCSDCGVVEEFADAALCKEEERIARGARFMPMHHVSDIVGMCSSCQ